MKKTLAVALAFVMLFALAAPVLAVGSPEAGKKLTVVVIENPVAKPEANTVTVSENVDDGSMVQTYTAEEKYDGAEFKEWNVYRRDGSAAVPGTDYKLVENTALGNTTVKIVPLTDLIVAANYGDKKTDIKDAQDLFQDKSEPTGDVVTILAVVMVVALCGTVVCKKQLAK